LIFNFQESCPSGAGNPWPFCGVVPSAYYMFAGSTRNYRNLCGAMRFSFCHPQGVRKMKFLTAIAAAGMLAATPVLAQSVTDEQNKADYHQGKADAARADQAKTDAQVQAEMSATDAANAQAQANMAQSDSARLQARADAARSAATSAQTQANASASQAEAAQDQAQQAAADQAAALARADNARAALDSPYP
jgi:hypothetical protein